VPSAQPSAARRFRSGWIGIYLLAGVASTGCLSWPAQLASQAVEGLSATESAAIGAVATRRPPQARQSLIAALSDQDLQVRLAAVAGLGRLGGPDAQAALQRLLEDRGELIRAAAVSALAEMHADQAVLKARADKSWRVRLAVAEALQQYTDRHGMAAARELLDDPNPTVQLRVVTSVGKWPARQAASILWEALGKNTYLTRQTAARQLAALWPPAAEFPVNGTPRQQAEFLQTRQADFRRQFPRLDADSLAEAAAASRAASLSALPPERLAQLASLVDRLADPQASQAVRQAATRELTRFGPGLTAALERLAIDEHRLLPETIYRDVLPPCDPEFAVLDQLTSSDVLIRRRASTRLAELAQQRPLGRLALERLAAIVVKEPEMLVWRSILGAIAADPGEPSIRLGYAALTHPAAEVRRLACEHLAAHADPRHAAVLLPALTDPHVSVVLAAVRALGVAGDARAADPLKQLLTSPNESLRLEVAVSLARLGNRSGPAALERLAYSNDPAIRRQVATAMGQLGDPSFAPTLVRLLDDQHAVRLAALASLPQVTGREPPVSDGPAPLSLAERIEFWKRAVGSRQ